MDLTALVAEYGAEYKNDPKARERLRSKLYNNNSAWDNFFTRIPTDATQEDWGFTEHDEVLQPYQEDWTPKGTLTAMPNPIKLFWAKADIEKVPDQLTKTWMGFLRESGYTNPLDYSFVRWYLENHLIPRMHQDRYLAWGYLGSYTAPTAGTAGAASTTGDGLRKIIRGHVTAGNITPWVGGTFPTTAAGMVDYIERMVKALPEQYRMMPMDIAMRQTNLDLYDEGFRVKYNTYFMAEKELTVRNYPNIKLVGFGNMGTSNLVFASQKSNRLLLQKGSVKKELVRLETALRKVYAFTDFHEGFGFDNPTEVFTNDQDLS
ncbi:MAG: hypothetical protein JNL05_12920 [Flavobacteriales bacterium]|nr:hypothetical protein [Flavobacteriales bacterium]